MRSGVCKWTYGLAFSTFSWLESSSPCLSLRTFLKAFGSTVSITSFPHFEPSQLRPRTKMPRVRGRSGHDAPTRPVTRQGRVSKTIAQDTIRRAVLPCGQAPGPSFVPPDSTRIPHDPSLHHSPARPLSPALPSITVLPTERAQLDVHGLGEILKNSLAHLSTEIRQANNSMYSQLVELLDGRPATGTYSLPSSSTAVTAALNPPNVLPPEIPSTLPTVPLNSTTLPAVPLNALSHWYWVDTATIHSIDDGSFDIYSLPKLHREEDYRNRHIAKTTEGIRYPLDGGRPEVIVGRTKMHQAFKDPNTFFSAWQIYISIRSFYHHDHASSLAFWTERLFFWLDRYPWHNILNYVIAYFQDRKYKSSESWFDTNEQLFLNCIAIAPPKTSTSVSTPSATMQQSAPKGTSRQLLGVNTEQVCFNHNYAQCKFGTTCRRRHICAVCEDHNHIAGHCPSVNRPSTSKK